MIITVLREELRDALLICERFSSRQLTLPVVGNVLLKTLGQKLKIQATNLEMGIEVPIQAKVIKEGMITVPPRILSSLLQTITEEKITLEEKQGTLCVDGGTSQSEIRGIPGGDFPIMPNLGEGTVIKILNNLLINQISRVIPSITPSDFKPEISGILFNLKKNNLIIAGTDTFRLSEAKIKEFSVQGDYLPFIIPLRPIQELIKIARPDDETKFNFKDSQVAIETGEGIKIISRLISGKYPEYEGLIPKEFAASLRLPRVEMLNTVKLSGVFATKLNDIILTYRTNNLIVEIINPEVGKFTKEIKAKVSGKSGKIGFNYRYLSDALDVLSSDDVLLSLTDETKPVLIQDEADQSFFSILMPIRIG